MNNPHRRTLAAALVGLVTASSAVAHAQQDAPDAPTAPAVPPVVVAVTVDRDEAPLAADAVRDAIARELGTTVLAPSEQAPSDAYGHITIASDAEHRLVVIYRDASGREVWRTITRPADPAAALATIAFMAGNLARPQADQVLAEIEHRRQVAAPPPPLPPVVLVLPPVILAPPLTLPAMVFPAPPPAVGRVVAPPANPQDRHGGHVAVYGTAGWATAGYASGGAATLGVEMYRWRYLSLAAETGLAALNATSTATEVYANQFRLWFSPMVLAHVPVGPFRFEFGGGAALNYADASAILPLHTAVEFHIAGVGVGLMTVADVALAVTRRLDLIVRTQWLFGGGGSDSTGEQTYWLGTTSVGLQGRFL